MFGKSGIFADVDTTHNYTGPGNNSALWNQDVFIDSEEKIPSQFGLAYKFILTILYRVQNHEDFKGRNIKLTVSGAEVSYRDPMDLLTKKVITLDLNSNRFRGLK